MRGERGTRRAWLAVAIVVGWTVAVAIRFWPTSGLSWHFFPAGAAQLFGSSGLHLYADHPGYQIGPLSFVVAWLLSPLGATGARVSAQLLMTATGPACVALLLPVLPRELRGRRVLWATLVLVPGWVVLSARWAHLDDVLAMLFATLALRFVLRGRAAWAGAMIAAAAASKPWAIEFSPLLLGLDRRVWHRAAIALGAGLALAWGPFVVAAPATLRALRPAVLLAPGSGLYAFGVRGQLVPAWDRTVTFVAATAIAALAQLRGRWAGVLVAAIAVRIALDPQNNAYYLGGAALAAVVYDLFGTRWRGPWLTLATTVVLWQPFTADWDHRLTTTTGYAHWWFSHLGAVGWIHLAWCAAVVLLVLLGPPPPANAYSRRPGVDPASAQRPGP